jgi:serine/threonine-protein kinase
MIDEPNTIGRYTIYGEIASGGMATVHVGRAQGHGGFARMVAIKRLHPHLAQDPDFVAMFLDEAWLAARIHHPNVVQTIDIVSEGGELFLVMEFVHGEMLSLIWRALRETEKPLPPPASVTASIVCGILHGLHAAHEARDEAGKALNIVHRDVSPQNVMVGTDGIARLLDFGVAKAAVRLQSTYEGQVKGKIAYMAPEQLDHHQATRSSDIYATAVLFWEGLAGKRLFEAASEGQLVSRVLAGPSAPPSASSPEVSSALDAIVMRGLSRDPRARFASAREMALAIERTVEIARASQVGEWVENAARPLLAKKADRVAELLGNSGSRSAAPPRVRESTGVRTLVDASPSGRVRVSPPTASSRPAPSEATPSSTGGRSSTTAKAAARRILVIDDSEVILSKIKRALEDDGYDVITSARTVGNARYLVDTDLVIVDYHMPGLDGGTVITSLRAAAAPRARPCLFYLYTQDPGIAKDYARLGFDGCFTEKGDSRALLRQVRSVFRVVQLRALRKS